MKRRLWRYIALACLLAGASGGHAAPIGSPGQLAAVTQVPGPTPFVSNITINLQRYAELVDVTYTIAAKPGTWSRPVTVTYGKSWLDRNGAFDPARQRIAISVFGLYANHANNVSVRLRFRDGSIAQQQMTIQTPAYAGTAGVYLSPAIRIARGQASVPGFDYFYLKNGLGSPVVIDTDGNLRWIASGVPESISSRLVGDSFFVGSNTSPTLNRVRLGGTTSARPLSVATYTNFHHDLTPGKIGLLAELDATHDSPPRAGTILAEIDVAGMVLKEWDLGAIFSTYMLAHGDDPTNFVRAGADWFHMNSAIYDARDDSLLVSSRENFVAKIGYTDGQLKWLFGDPAKHWFVDYPSLRALALRLTAGKAPVGQHALSLLANGDLLLFNNGLGSLTLPPPLATGITRKYSAPSRYTINEAAHTAAEVWSYDHVPTIYSDICSSVREASPGHYLLAYAVANNRTMAVVSGVDAQGSVAFEFAYPTNLCAVSFMAEPVALEAFRLD